MRIVNIDALPRCWQPGANFGRWFIDGADVEATRTVCCAECRHSVHYEGSEKLYCSKGVCSETSDYHEPDFGCAYWKPREDDET